MILYRSKKKLSVSKCKTIHESNDLCGFGVMGNLESFLGKHCCLRKNNFNKNNVNNKNIYNMFLELMKICCSRFSHFNKLLSYTSCIEIRCHTSSTVDKEGTKCDQHYIPAGFDFSVLS